MAWGLVALGPVLASIDMSAPELVFARVVHGVGATMVVGNSVAVAWLAGRRRPRARPRVPDSWGD